MKKFFTLALAVLMVVSCFAISTSAADGELKMGTAKVDGILDDLYTGSVMIKGVGSDLAKNQLNPEWDGSCVADIYIMYDNDYLYLFAHVTNDDLLTRGRAYCTSNNPIYNDCFGLPKHCDIMDYSTFIYEVVTDEEAGAYAIELAIPCTKGKLDLIKCSTLGFAF